MLHPNRLGLALVFFLALTIVTESAIAETWFGVPAQIGFISPSPADGASTTNVSVMVWANITAPNLLNMSWNWNGTNYSIINKSVIAMYNFNNFTGLAENNTHIVDITGNGRNGTTTTTTVLNQSIWKSSGMYGGAFNFDGFGDSIEIGTNIGLLDTSGAVTAWFKRNEGDSSNNKFIFSHRDGTENNRVYMYVQATDNRFYCGFGNTQTAMSGAVVQNDTWYFATITWTSAQGRCYLNGVLQNTYNYDLTTTDGAARIGGGTGTAPNPTLSFNGTIDEVSIWNATLTQPMIEELYYSNLMKYDSENYTFYIRQSNITTTGLAAGTYNYSAYITNSSGIVNGTDTRSITISQNPPNLSITYDFDNGNVSTYELVNDNTIDLTLSNDESRTTKRYWIHFNVTNTSGKTMTFRITNIVQDAYSFWAGNGRQPVYSCDGETWTRVTTVSDSGTTAIFSAPISCNQIEVASSYPYSYGRLQNYLHTINNSHSYVNVSNIGLSDEGRNISLINITNPLTPATDKATVVIIARQHASESFGSWSVQGLVDFLLSSNPNATKLRNEIQWFIVPMVNPDGVYHGYDYKDANGLDTNDYWIWGTTTSNQVNVVRKYIDSIENDYDIDLFLDWHDVDYQESFADVNGINKLTEAYAGASYYGNLTRLFNNISLWSNYDRPYESTTSGLARVEIYDQYDTLAITPEAEAHNNSFTIQSLKNDGENMSYAIGDYFLINWGASDTTKPFVWTFSPNASYYNTSTMFLQWIASDTELSSVWVNYSGYLSNMSIVENITLLTAEGTNNLTLYANDTTGNINSSVPFTVNVDTIAPNIVIDNTTSTILTISSITIQGICSASGLASVGSVWTNSAYFTTHDSSGSVWNITNTTNMPNGTYTVRVYCNDTYGNNNQYSSLSFTLGYTASSASANKNSQISNAVSTIIGLVFGIFILLFYIFRDYGFDNSNLMFYFMLVMTVLALALMISVI